MMKLIFSWHISLLTAIGLIFTVAVWCCLAGKKKPSHHRAFLAAFLLLLVCFCSPLALLSTSYLFSAHMAVHVILLLIVGPLLAMSVPASSRTSRLSQYLARYPWLCWLAGVGSMWLWHIPVLFNLMMQHTSPWQAVLHPLENVNLILAGILFAWPVFSAAAPVSLHPLVLVVYLFSACIFCSILGMAITFAPPATYLHYLSRADALGFNQLIISRWQISKAMDQQAAGLLMWVPCCLVYVTGALLVLRKYFAEDKAADRVTLAADT